MRQSALILLYRLLFVGYAEDRDLLPDQREPYKSNSLSTMRLDIAERRDRKQVFSGSATRLTNAFSMKIENHAHSVALFTMHYNFVRIHKTLRTTPAMAANVTKRLWEIGDVVDVLEAWEAAS